MLESTFQHIKGISDKKEKSLWEKGILSWDSYEEHISDNFPLFSNIPNYEIISIFEESRKALKASNVGFFGEKLNPKEYYRIALSFPNDILFLDIETTGLSIFYDDLTLVGWNYNNEFNVYIRGGDDTKLRNDLSKAKIIITFNGTLFDIPFLRKEFESINIPAVHIDLRYFSRRLGLRGGQKKIEQEIGFQRNGILQNLDGEKAPLLWFKYKSGDVKALKELIEYNHSDVEGMKWIFNYSVKKFIELEAIPKKILSNYKTNIAVTNKFQWKRLVEKYNFQIKSADEDTKSKFCYSSLNVREDLRIIGIDLTGSEARPSGWCFLDGNIASTKVINSDNDLIQESIAVHPHLISIDSPLSLPKGRTSVFDDDPCREYGIMRYCERLLKKRGVNVYPSLIPSMQKLTARGIRLATHFRSLGFPVIESYPGAAQDILGIPRKRAGLEFLSKGLEDFGLKGEFTEKKLIHDELDAITSALVGVFFWSGYFEAIGNEDEDYLIIPDIKQAPHKWDDRIVIGFSGPIAAGKTFASTFLKSKGFVYGRFSQVLAEEINKRNMEVNRENLQKVGLEINTTLGQRWLGKKLLEQFPKCGNLVIDGMRFPEDHSLLMEQYGPKFLHIYIDSPIEIRRTRFEKRDGAMSNPEKFEVYNSNDVESKISKLKELANFVIENSNEDGLYKKIQEIIEK